MDRPPWFIDELDHAGQEHLTPAYVALYDRKADFEPDEDLTLLRSFGFGAESTLIDLGAGTGTFAIAAAPACRRVVAVDISSPMLEAARAKAERQRLSNLELVQQGFLTYEHAGEKPDFVFTKNALHHLPDFWKAVALQRIASVLKPHGVLRLRDLVFSFGPEDAGRAIEAWLEVAPIRPEDGWTRSELETHLRSEYSTFSWLLEPMLVRAGFEIRQATYSESGMFAAYVCARR